MAARSVWSPLVTGTTVVPNNFMRPTFGACRSMSTEPMYTVHGRPTRAQAAAVATPCWPAPVSATMRFTPRRLASSACPSALLILCAPVCARSSRFSHTSAPQAFDNVFACVSAVGRPTQLRSSPASSSWKSFGVQVLLDRGFEFLEGGNQCFRDVAAAEGAEAATGVGIFSRQLVGQ
jgi:hypothetical protein